MTNPYTLANFAALRTTDPVLYQRMSNNGFFTATTTQRNRLLRPFSQMNNLSFSNLPLGEVKVHSLQVNANRRFSGGFTANVAMSFNSSRANRTVEEYDREPTLWWDDNNSRPFRLSGGAVYELPFGTGKPMLSDGGVLAAIAGGWQTGGTFEYQPGSVIVFNTNLFYYGNIGDIKKGDPEIALNADGTLDADEVLVQHRELRAGSNEVADELPDARLPVPSRRLAGTRPEVRQHQLRRATSGSGAGARFRRASTFRTCSTTRRSTTRSPTRPTPTSGR